MGYTSLKVIIKDAVMSQLMEKAIIEMRKLAEQEQDRLASLILEELASERHWADLFDQSQDLLGQLADEALAEHRAGKTLQ
jgi:hypothetical protein